MRSTHPRQRRPSKVVRSDHTTAESKAPSSMREAKTSQANASISTKQTTRAVGSANPTPRSSPPTPEQSESTVTARLSTRDLARLRNRRYRLRQKLRDPGANKRHTAAWRARNPERSRESSRASYARHSEQRRMDARARFQRLKRNGYSADYRERDRAKKERRRAQSIGVLALLTAAEWRAICERFDHCCAYCHRRRPLEQDHVVPLSKGGQHTADNIVPACKSCNCAKGNRLLSEYPTQAKPTPAHKASP